MRKPSFAFARLFLAVILLSSAMGALKFQPGSASPVNGEITLRIQGTAQPVHLDPLFLGTNLPAWLNPDRLADPVFRTRVVASGVKVVRMPGGSWSNAYDWLACERGGEGIDDQAVCDWPWAARPSDFASFLAATGLEGIYTVNQNGTAQEAAALVAFFNGSTSDTRSIGVDARGRDWGKVSDWANLRAQNGNPNPVGVRFWEVGNEIYGGKPGSGKDCQAWGWEDVWTCDGVEYVNGIGSGADHQGGYLEFRAAMQAVDSSIQVGAVGISDLEGWGDWGREVIGSAGQVMDFYTVHEYGFFEPPGSYGEILAHPQEVWGPVMEGLSAAFQQQAGGRSVPVVVTEHNLFAEQEGDPDAWMSRAVNGLFVADSIGEMLSNGVATTNQWDVAHGEEGDDPGYGMMQAVTYFRSPQYYVFPLWARFGSELLPVDNPLSADMTLSVYAGRIDDDTYSLFAINKTGSSIAAAIEVDGVSSFAGGLADVVRADSLDSKAVTFNGDGNPADDLSNAPPAALSGGSGAISYTFQPYSVTLLRLDVGVAAPLPPLPLNNAIRNYLPLVFFGGG